MQYLTGISLVMKRLSNFLCWHLWISIQEEAAALEDRLHVLRRVNSQLTKSQALTQQGVTNAQQQVHQHRIDVGQPM